MIFSLLVVLAFGSRISFAAETLPGEPNVAWVRDLFSILPETTETVVVMGPCKYVPIEPQSFPEQAPDGGAPRKYDPIDFDTSKLPDDLTPAAAPSVRSPQWTISQMAFQANLHLFTCHPVFKPFVETQPIALSVWAFRPVEFKFEFPGGTRTEGCQLLVPQGAFPDSVVNLFRTAKKSIAGHAVIEGHMDDRPLDHPSGMVNVGEPDGPQTLVPEGVQLPEKREKNHPDGALFFAMPTARLLIAANSETLLTSLLQEVSKPPAERSGFTYPADLPGAPRIWGLRRFGAGYTQAGPTTTTRAEYLMCLFDPPTRRVEFRIKSTDPSLPADFSDAWQEFTNLELRVVPFGSGQCGGSVTITDGLSWVYVIGILGILVLL